jgi:tetratricopeptide (TPR) repeat protein
MAVLEPEDKLRQRRTKSEQAITLAVKNRWSDAVDVNREILHLFPSDVDALNRLGKALSELGRYAEARDAYAAAVKIDPMNGIATKNLQRLEKLAAGGAAAPPPSPVDPRIFIAESGKTTVTQLTDVRRTDASVNLAAGDQLRLSVRGHQISVENSAGEFVGRIEPKLEHDLVKLLAMGNEYTVFVTSVSDQAVHVIIRESRRSPAMGNRPSFRPSAAAEAGFRSYTREGTIRYDYDEEEEELAEEDEAEPEATAVDADAVEETPIEVLAQEEEDDTEEAN